MSCNSGCPPLRPRRDPRCRAQSQRPGCPEAPAGPKRPAGRANSFLAPVQERNLVICIATSPTELRAGSSVTRCAVIGGMGCVEATHEAAIAGAATKKHVILFLAAPPARRRSPGARPGGALDPPRAEAQRVPGSVRLRDPVGRRAARPARQTDRERARSTASAAGLPANLRTTGSGSVPAPELAREPHYICRRTSTLQLRV
jgi:hypothetical protein